MKKIPSVLHLSYSDKKGGAALACLRIHQALTSNGTYSSTLLVKNKNLNDNSIIPIYDSKIGVIYGKIKSSISRKIQYLQKTENKILHSSSCLPCTLHSRINNHNADLVHLHWVQSETISIKSIGLITKPTIWTLHDSWPFCGCEHHPNYYYLDKRFINGYTINNKPNGNFGIDLDRWTWLRKVKSFRNKIHLVAPSKWMERQVKSSILMKNWDVKVIPNPVTNEFFSNYDDNTVRELFDLPKNKFLILCAGYNLTYDFNKGFDLLDKILDYLDFLDKEKDIELILVGVNKKNINFRKNIKTHFFSYITDINKLSMLYSSSNLLCITSRIENQSQMIAEGQALGVPPVAFNTSGNTENIEHKKTGLLVKPFDCKEFAESIIEIKNNPVKYNLIKKFSREFASLKYNSKNIAKLYTELYGNILHKT